MIKIKSILWLMVAAIAGGLTIASCSSSDSSPVVIPPRDNTPVDYTIMFYSAGGENLDYQTELDLMRAAKALQTSDKQVRFIVQYKYSTEDGLKTNYPDNTHPCGYAGGLYRFELLPSQIQQNGELGYFSDNLLYGNQQSKSELFRSDSITSFINYCQRVAPAKNYILILSDHGSGYLVNDDYPKTRSIVSDKFHEGKFYKNEVPAISIYDIRDGIRNSNLKHVKMINFDACLMNTIEVISELTEVTDYVMASSFTTSGGDYMEFVNHLRGVYDDAAFENKMRDYLNKTIQDIYNPKTEDDNNAKYLPPSDPQNKRCDWVLTNTAKFKAAVIPAMIAFTTKLINQDVNNFDDSGLKDAAIKCYHPDATSPLYDIGQYATLLAKANNSLNAEATALKTAIGQAQVCHYYTNPVLKDFEDLNLDYKSLSYTINLGATVKDDQGNYKTLLRILAPDDAGTKVSCNESNGYSYNYIFATGTCELDTQEECDVYTKWDNTYRTTAFDRATRWSKWIEKNPYFPTGNPPFTKCK